MQHCSNEHKKKQMYAGSVHTDTHTKVHVLQHKTKETLVHPAVFLLRYLHQLMLVPLNKNWENEDRHILFPYNRILTSKSRLASLDIAYSCLVTGKWKHMMLYILFRKFTSKKTKKNSHNTHFCLSLEISSDYQYLYSHKKNMQLQYSGKYLLEKTFTNMPPEAPEGIFTVLIFTTCTCIERYQLGC